MKFEFASSSKKVLNSRRRQLFRENSALLHSSIKFLQFHARRQYNAFNTKDRCFSLSFRKEAQTERRQYRNRAHVYCFSFCLFSAVFKKFPQLLACTRQTGGIKGVTQTRALITLCMWNESKVRLRICRYAKAVCTRWIFAFSIARQKNMHSKENLVSSTVILLQIQNIEGGYSSLQCIIIKL